MGCLAVPVAQHYSLEWGSDTQQRLLPARRSLGGELTLSFDGAGQATLPPPGRCAVGVGGQGRGARAPLPLKRERAKQPPLRLVRRVVEHSDGVFTTRAPSVGRAAAAAVPPHPPRRPWLVIVISRAAFHVKFF